MSGYIVSVQQALAWKAPAGTRQTLGARGVFALPAGATAGDTRAALKAVAQRHEILRTTVTDDGGLLLQVIGDEGLLDWAEAPSDWTAAGWLARLHTDNTALVAGWVRGPDGPRLALSISALHGDAVTLHQIAKEVQDALRGQPAAQDPVQYADYAQWQHEEQPPLPSAMSALDAPVPSRLPLETPSRGEFRRITCAVPLSRDCSEHEALAAWAWLLSRHIEQPRWTLGLLVDGRSEEVADACGPYARVLPLVVGPGGECWGEWMQSLRTGCDSLTAQPEHHAGEALPVQFAWSRPPAGAQVLDAPMAYRLRLECCRHDKGLQTLLSADAQSLTPEALAEMAQQLASLLQGQWPADKPLVDLPLTVGDVAHRATAGLCAGETALGDSEFECLLSDRIAEQARRHGERTAVYCGGRSLSYAELDQRAEQLATRLVADGAGPDRIVAVCLQRSVDLVVAVLGVMKAGAAYLPLDPAYPPERLAYMLQDSGARWLVVNQATSAAALPSSIGLRTIDVNQPPSSPATRARPRPLPDQLAYLIYTSGSTGRPKGVAITHRNALHSTLARHRWYAEPVRAYLMLSSVSFDSSVAGIFWTLTQGGELVLPMEGDQRDVTELARLVQARRASHLLALPSLYAQLLQQRELLTSLSTTIVAGEACPASVVAAHAAALPQTQLVNEYGPTEVSVWSVAHRVDPVGDAVAGQVPIGRPIPFVDAHVLDDDLRPLPPGVAGELYLGGPTVARGYLGRPELSAERFVPHLSTAGARLYRTGDRVRQRIDGSLDFLGRRDAQIKLRGFRIELGEIEACLAEAAGVTSAAVIVREDQPGAQRLVGYAAGQGLSADALRAHLSRSLPEHLLPSVIVVLDELPLTPNGKVDRRSLPAPEEDRPQRAKVAPRNPTESLLAAIWCDLLGGDQIGVHDNFFELGGHSLLAAQVATRVRRSFQIEMPVREVFAAPTIAALAEQVDARRRSGRHVLLDAPIARLTAAQRAGEMPLSFAQQRLWFLAQLEPDDPSYHIAGVLRLRGQFDAAAWDRAFDALQRHHEVLRSRFMAGHDGRPMLQLAAEPLASLQTMDLRAMPDARAQADAIAHRDATQAFALANGPMVRARLLRLADDEHELVLVLHHIVSDGSGTERLLQDWATLYEQAMRAELPTLPLPALDYADYAAWQRDQLTEEVLSAELAHWREVLGDEQPLLALPTDRPRPSALSGRGGRVEWHLPPELSRAARQFAHRHNATLFMLLEAAFAALLSRYANQRDIRVGTPVSGRDRLELEPVVGLFVNTVVLRHTLAPGDGLAALVAQVRHQVLEASQHQQLPFERLVDALAPARDLSHQPLFQAMFDLQTERYAALSAIAGVQATLVPLDTASSKFDLSLTCANDGVQISAVFEYSGDLFEAATIRRLARHYEALLQAGLRSPARPLADLPLLGEQEARALCPAPQAYLPHEQGFAALFDVVVRTQGDRIAVRDGSGDTLNYRQLQQRARALAAALKAAGATPDAPVAVLLPRSNDYLVAIVASLVAGCAWLPLDVGLPEARLTRMLAQARVPVLVTDTGSPLTRSIVSGLSQPPVLLAPTAVSEAAWHAAAPHGDRLAYVIYTSGSTGTPKGAMVTCAGMLNNLLGKVGQLQLTSDDRIAQTASPCFDISVWQFLTALLCGARVEIVPDVLAKDAAALLQAVNERGITVLESVPSLMRGMLADPDAPDSLPRLRWLLPTGEALPPALARRWFACFPGVPLLNAYGPAECADDVALWRLDTAPAGDLVHLPIGRAADNLRLVAVNDALQIQPAGVVGELVIGGIGVGRGYLGDPALTAERFVPDPFGPPGSRCYRSGDLVRQATDGVFTFLGRRDHQVKVRGYRVEPGEVEARLMQHPEVRAAAVLLHGEPVRLVAYVAADAALDAQALRRFVGEQLPDYMVPAVCTVLADWPLNANGKLDRSRLPPPGTEPAQHHDAGAMTSVQAQLARVWAEVLGVSAVGLHDNFFALGGDSILVIQVVAKAREAGWKLSARSLFLHQTIESLAAVAEPLQAAAPRPVPTGVLPLTPIQHAFFAVHGARPHHWNQSVLLTPARPLRAASLRAAVAAVAARHDALRLRFSRDGDAWSQCYAGAETHDVFVEPALFEERPQAGALMTACDALQASLNVEQGPLWRVGLLSASDGRQRLLLACHHLVVDGVSLRLLLNELAAAYEQVERGAEVRLSPRVDSFQDWANDLVRRAAAGVFDAELPYWQAQVAPVVPVERPDGSRAEGDADTVSVRLGAEDTARLLRCAEWHARPDDFLLAALAAVLARWSGQPAVLVEMEGHGRPDHLDVSTTVGWFTAAYPLRLVAEPGASELDQLKGVKQALRSVPGGGVGYGVLRHLCRRLDDAAPQVSFNYLGQFDGQVGQGGSQATLWAGLHADSGRLYDRQAPRPQEFDLNSYVLAGQLCLDWRFGAQRYRRETVQQLADAFIERLARLLHHAAGGELLTPQDFPDAGLDDDALAQLLAGME